MHLVAELCCTNAGLLGVSIGAVVKLQASKFASVITCSVATGTATEMTPVKHPTQVWWVKLLSGTNLPW